jgi:hypothetical protein
VTVLQAGWVRRFAKRLVAVASILLFLRCQTINFADFAELFENGNAIDTALQL